MANQLSLTVGANTISIPINLTAVQIRAVIKRCAVASGIPIEGRTDVEIAEDVLKMLKKIVADRSASEQRKELLSAQRAIIESTVSADNDI
jgi:antitoxin component of RelBE/YafQ-DinJ toxin-antitoxin module